MKTDTKYLLLLDPHHEFLALQETALSCFYGGDIHALKDPGEVLALLKSKGMPELVIIDSSFVGDFSMGHLSVPMVATSVSPKNENHLKRYPSITAVIGKPIIAQTFSKFIKSLTNTPSRNPTHIPVKADLLLRLGTGNFDLFLKLSENNFVKIRHKSEYFSKDDAKNLKEKGIQELFIKIEDSKILLKILENDLTKGGDQPLDLDLTLDNLVIFEQIAKRMNWSPDVILTAERSVTHAVKILSKNKSILRVIKKRLQEPTSTYSKHISLMTYLTCAACSAIGWIGESGQVKLALASLVHDAAVGEEYYENIHEWNRRAADPTDKSPETVKYRMHPIEASKFINRMESFSVDVDQIILQHHEVKNGTGFPRGIDSKYIGLLPALFIIVEDLMDFIDRGDDIEKNMKDFIQWGQEHYDTGHFKKLFNAMAGSFK